MTTSEACKKFNISRARLHIWRRGDVSRGYTYPPKLIAGVHWVAEGLHVVYTPLGIQKISELLNKKTG